MKYKATQSVGQYLPGELVEGLSDERAKALLVMGAIVEIKDDPAETQDGANPRRSRTKPAE